MYMYYFDLKTSTFPISPHLTSPTIFKLLVGETSCTGLGGEAGEELDEKELWAAPRTSEGRRRLTPHLAGGQPCREQSQSIPAQNPGLARSSVTPFMMTAKAGGTARHQSSSCKWSGRGNKYLGRLWRWISVLRLSVWSGTLSFLWEVPACVALFSFYVSGNLGDNRWRAS